jgi:hypothetical protein
MLSFYQEVRCARLTQLFLGGELALAGLPEPDLAAGQRVLSGVDLGTPKPPLIAPFARVARSTNRFHALSLS